MSNINNFLFLDKSAEETLKKLIVLGEDNEIIEIFSNEFSLSVIGELANKGFVSKLSDQGKPLSAMWDCRIKLEERGRSYFSGKEQYQSQMELLQKQKEEEKALERTVHNREFRITIAVSIISMVVNTILTFANLIVPIIAQNQGG